MRCCPYERVRRWMREDPHRAGRLTPRGHRERPVLAGGIKPDSYYSWTKDPSASSGQESRRPARRGSPVMRGGMPLSRRSARSPRGALLADGAGKDQSARRVSFLPCLFFSRMLFVLNLPNSPDHGHLSNLSTLPIASGRCAGSAPPVFGGPALVGSVHAPESPWCAPGRRAGSKSSACPCRLSS